MIDITYTITKPEYIEAQRLYITSKRSTMRKYAVWICYAIILLSAVVMVTVTRSALLPVVIAIVGYAILLAALTWFGKWFQTYRLGKRFLTESKFLSNAHMVVESGGFQSSIDGIGESKTEWTAFSDWLEGPNVFAILAGYTFRPIPKRVLSADQQAELRTLLATHIKKPTK